jgi:(2Fe-2S) ferredoxin
MGKSKKQTSELQLEGRFLGFVSKKKGKAGKQFGLSTDRGERCITLDCSKKERAVWQARLTPGDWVQVEGEKKFNPKSGKVKLKADRIVLPVGTASSAPQETEECAIAPHCPIADNCSHSQTNGNAEKTPRKKKASILVCQKSACRKRGGSAICDALQDHLRHHGLDDAVTIKGTGCMKRCKAGPNVIVMPDKTRYSKIDPQEIPHLIANHF